MNPASAEIPICQRISTLALMTAHLLALSTHWREKAARIREKWKGFGASGDAAMHAAVALETCAEDLEMLLAEKSRQENMPAL